MSDESHDFCPESAISVGLWQFGYSSLSRDTVCRPRGFNLQPFLDIDINIPISITFNPVVAIASNALIKSEFRKEEPRKLSVKCKVILKNSEKDVKNPSENLHNPWVHKVLSLPRERKGEALDKWQSQVNKIG